MEPRRARPTSLRSVGLVAIGRNEGERLRRCFDSLPPGLGGVVYVDSASTDGSAEEARRRGFDVVELDLSAGFTAARARNAGMRRLRELHPEIAHVQLVDGDCSVVPGWIEDALRHIEDDPRRAVVCGRRREIHREASVYNRLADMEWDGPAGEVASCGGDALVRLDAVLGAGGFDGRLIAGEEPELCARLRAGGWTIRRLDRDMTMHDAAMIRLAQWWRRAVRSGYGFADVGAVRPGLYRRELRSSLLWAVVLPAIALGAAPWTGGRSLALLLAYPAQWVRVLLRVRGRARGLGDAAAYAAFCLAGKLPETVGALRRGLDGLRGRSGRLIEYK